MAPHMKRVVDEARELDDKIAKLSTFTLDTAGVYVTLDYRDQLLLQAQLDVMKAYATILASRIAFS